MTESTREQQLLQTFAALADTLVADYDVVDLMQTLVDRCLLLLDVTAAGILLADDQGDLELVVSTSEASRLVETMQLSADAGPCIECFRTGRAVAIDDIRSSPAEWQPFRDQALDQGFLSVQALPLRLRESTIGTLNLMRTVSGPLPEGDLIAAQALADVATIGIIQERTLREAETVREQLQNALSTRIVIEQAKGVVAHQRSVTTEQAFEVIRSYARSHRQSLTFVATELVNRRLSL
jgi:transcriptional regulator with GAF, ATPase, and Fis domain